MLTVWGRKTSSNVQAVMWCLGELDVPCTRHDAGHVYGVTDTPDFRAMNPNGTVPVLQDDGIEPLWETGAILRYLGARYGRSSFWPEDPVKRAPVDKWAEWAKITVAGHFTTTIFWRLVRTPAKDRNMAAIESAIGVLGRSLDIAEAELARHAFIAGDIFTLADIQFGHWLYRYYDLGIDKTPRPALRRYYEALMERPAYREHVMISYDVLRVA